MEKGSGESTYQEVLENNNFYWNSKQEWWERKQGFGRKDTIEVMFKCLFIMHRGKKKVHDNFIETFEEFKEVFSEFYR